MDEHPTQEAFEAQFVRAVGQAERGELVSLGSFAEFAADPEGSDSDD